MERFHGIVVTLVCAACVVLHAQAGLTGKWEGTTGTGRRVVLDVRVKGKQLTGTFTLGQQSADITEGKVEGKTFSFKATMDDRAVAFDGRLDGEQVELTPQAAARPVTLKRAK
jgi:hypothetical protein